MVLERVTANAREVAVIDRRTCKELLVFKVLKLGGIS
jgi:hypothetical protein